MSPPPGSTTANVFYVNRASSDFRLEPYSPAVNKGVDLGLDLNGPDAGRFNGSAPDFGATESPY